MLYGKEKLVSFIIPNKAESELNGQQRLLLCQARKILKGHIYVDNNTEEVYE